MPIRTNISLTNLCLDLQNPRKVTSSQEEAFEYLCDDVKIGELAEDIVSNGLNPLELIGVFKEINGLWCALEGNRRICALKLLNEPELAPTSKLKQKFQKLKASWSDPITSIECVCFDSRDEADIWLDRLHQGLQDGIGRKEWDSEQKSLRSEKPENKRALMVLGYARQMKWVSETDTAGKLTTASRYLNNEGFRKTLGLDDDITTLKRTRPETAFNLLMHQFTKDLINSKIDGWVSSRANKIKITEYAEHLNSSIVDSTIIHPVPALHTTNSGSKKTAAKSKAKKPTSPPQLSIEHNSKLYSLLKTHGNTKLNSLYYSLCILNLNEINNTPLATVGAWSFTESLTRDCGRSDSTDFATYAATKYQRSKIIDIKAINKALKDLSELGNLTKHNSKYANFNGALISTIMSTITPFFNLLLEDHANISS